MTDNAPPPAAPPAAPSDPAAPPAPAPAQRPAYIPEKFWDGEKGAPRIEDLAKGYTTLESGRAKQKETLTAEINAERFKGRPAKAEDYKIALPEGLEGVVLLDKPPGEDFQWEGGKTYAMLKADSPLLKAAAAAAYKYGMPQAEFSSLVGELAKEMGFRPPTADDVTAARGAFTKQLGDQGEARLGHVEKQLEALGLSALKAANASVAEFEAIETLLEKTGQARFSAGTGRVGAPMPREKLEEIMASPDYYVNKDKQRIVEEGFAKLFPGKVNISNPNAAR